MAIDEFTIIEGKMFHRQTTTFLGHITLPNDVDGTVKHAILYFLTRERVHAERGGLIRFHW